VTDDLATDTAPVITERQRSAAIRALLPCPYRWPEGDPCRRIRDHNGDHMEAFARADFADAVLAAVYPLIREETLRRVAADIRAEADVEETRLRKAAGIAPAVPLMSALHNWVAGIQHGAKLAEGQMK
jgi:hypothetical protein